MNAEERREVQEKAEAAQAKAQEARTLLDHPLLQEAFSVYESTITALWKKSPPEATAERELLYQRWMAGQVFRTYLTRTIGAGKVAAETAARILADDSAGGDARNSD